MSLSSKISSALAYNALRVILSTVSSVIYSIVVVRWLQVQKFGGYAFLDSIFSILAVIYVLGTHAPIIRFAPELVAEEDYCRLRTLISSLHLVNLAGSSTATLLVFLGSDIALTALGKPELAFYARLMALGIIPKAVLGITKNILNAFYEQKFLSIFETLFSFLELSLLTTFVIGMNLELVGAIMAPLVSNSIAAVVYFVYVFKKYPRLFKGERCPIDTVYVRRVVKYTIPLTALDLINIFVNYAGNTFLGTLRNLEEVAYFDIPNSFANRVFQQMWLVIGYVGVVSLTEVNYSDMSKFKLAVQQYVKVISLYALPLTLGGIILAEPLLVIFYGEKVLPAVGVFRILLPAYCILNILGISSIILNVKERTHLLLIGGAFRSIAITVLSLWLIPILGVNGAIVSTVLPSAIVTLCYSCFVIIKLRTGNFLPLKAIGKYLASSLLMGVVVMALVYFVHVSMFLSLIVSLIAGPLTYVLALRVFRAFDQTDKRIFMSTKMPFKSTILKLLWEE
jgi:O-antigen/teichoic acid export membrane protein